MVIVRVCFFPLLFCYYILINIKYLYSRARSFFFLFLVSLLFTLFCSIRLVQVQQPVTHKYAFSLPIQMATNPSFCLRFVQYEAALINDAPVVFSV